MARSLAAANVGKVSAAVLPGLGVAAGNQHGEPVDVDVKRCPGCRRIFAARAWFSRRGLGLGRLGSICGRGLSGRRLGNRWL